MCHLAMDDVQWHQANYNFQYMSFKQTKYPSHKIENNCKFWYKKQTFQMHLAIKPYNWFEVLELGPCIQAFHLAP
jgi:hypothetical protein